MIEDMGSILRKVTCERCGEPKTAGADFPVNIEAVETIGCYFDRRDICFKCQKEVAHTRTKRKKKKWDDNHRGGEYES